MRGEEGQAFSGPEGCMTNGSASPRASGRCESIRAEAGASVRDVFCGVLPQSARCSEPAARESCPPNVDAGRDPGPGANRATSNAPGYPPSTPEIEGGGAPGDSAERGLPRDESSRAGPRNGAAHAIGASAAVSGSARAGDALATEAACVNVSGGATWAHPARDTHELSRVEERQFMLSLMRWGVGECPRYMAARPSPAGVEPASEALRAPCAAAGGLPEWTEGMVLSGCSRVGVAKQLAHVFEAVTASSTSQDGRFVAGVPAEVLLQRVSALQLVRKKVAECELAGHVSVRLDPPAGSSRWGDEVIPGWTSEHDLALMRGITRHGWGRWSDILSAGHLDAAGEVALSLGALSASTERMCIGMALRAQQLVETLETEAHIGALEPEIVAERTRVLVEGLRAAVSATHEDVLTVLETRAREAQLLGADKEKDRVAEDVPRLRATGAQDQAKLSLALQSLHQTQWLVHRPDPRMPLPSSDPSRGPGPGEGSNSQSGSIEEISAAMTLAGDAVATFMAEIVDASDMEKVKQSIAKLDASGGVAAGLHLCRVLVAMLRELANEQQVLTGAVKEHQALKTQIELSDGAAADLARHLQEALAAAETRLQVALGSATTPVQGAKAARVAACRECERAIKTFNASRRALTAKMEGMRAEILQLEGEFRITGLMIQRYERDARAVQARLYLVT